MTTCDKLEFSGWDPSGVNNGGPEWWEITNAKSPDGVGRWELVIKNDGGSDTSTFTITSRDHTIYPYQQNSNGGISKSYIGNGLYIQCGANSGQGMFVDRYDCRPESLYKDVFDPATIPVEVDGLTKDIKLDKLEVEPWEKGTASLTALDSAFGKVNSYRARAGAQQNRLEFTDNSLAVASANLQEANSRIADADMAKEMMAFTSYNVLVQAGVSMLAQANQVPAAVLQLLR